MEKVHSSIFLCDFRRHTPYYTHPEFRIHELNRRLQHRIEVCIFLTRWIKRNCDYVYFNCAKTTSNLATKITKDNPNKFMKTVSLVSNLCDFLGFIIFYQEIFIHYLAFCIATLLSCFKYWLQRSQMVIFFSFFEILFYAQFPQAKVWYWVLIWYFSWKNREKWNVRARENMKQKFRGLLEFLQQVDFFEDQVLFPCHMSGDVTDNWKKKCEGPFPVFVTVPWLQFQTTKKNCIHCVKINKKLCQIIEVNCSSSQWSIFYSLW